MDKALIDFFFTVILKPNPWFQQLIYFVFSVMNGRHYAMNNRSPQDLLHAGWYNKNHTSSISSMCNH